MKKISLIVIISIIFTVFFCSVSFSQTANLGIDTNILSSTQALSLINNNMLLQQQNDDDNTDNNNDDEVNIEVEKIKEDNGYPLWKILPNKYYESPFRRFEIIFFASFSYIFFLNVTLLTTITQIDPSDYGENIYVFDKFPLPLFFFTFACTTILALAVAFEDFRFVYIENAKPKKEKNQENNNSTTKPNEPKVSIYFAPKILFYDDYIQFRILMINF